MAFNFKRKIAKFKAKKKKLPVAIGAIAKSHYLQSFRDGGFTDNVLDPWAKRKRGNKSDRRNKANRAILIDKGHLRRSIRVIKATFNRVEVGSTGISYAETHNQGKGKAPKRQFIGKSAAMNRKIGRRIRRDISKIF